jgi:hypothetical protein
VSRVKQIMLGWVRARQWAQRDEVRRAKRLVLGIGTGRCGSTTLTHLLNSQPDCVATHEAYPLLAWHGDDALAVQKANAILSRPVPIAADVAWFYLPYVESILRQVPEARVICLERPKHEVVDSFLRKLSPGVNHWSDDPERKRHRLDGCFPHYDARLGLAAAIGRYWDEYKERVAALRREHPGQVGCWPMHAALNEEPVMRSMLRFAGFEEPAVQGAGLRLNAA